jgi:multidrug efflux pump subunit AcrA (membrane-fusion protein)
MSDPVSTRPVVDPLGASAQAFDLLTNLIALVANPQAAAEALKRIRTERDEALAAREAARAAFAELDQAKAAFAKEKEAGLAEVRAERVKLAKLRTEISLERAGFNELLKAWPGVHQQKIDDIRAGRRGIDLSNPEEVNMLNQGYFDRVGQLAEAEAEPPHQDIAVPEENPRTDAEGIAFPVGTTITRSVRRSGLRRALAAIDGLSDARRS